MGKMNDSSALQYNKQEEGPRMALGYIDSFKGRIDAFHILGYHVVKFDCAGAVVSRDIGFHHLHQSWFQCITLDEVLSFRKKSISSTPYSVTFASPYIKLILEFLHVPG